MSKFAWTRIIYQFIQNSLKLKWQITALSLVSHDTAFHNLFSDVPIECRVFPRTTKQLEGATSP